MRHGLGRAALVATKHFGNIVQKGQAGSAGGYFKIENPGGRPNCVFRPERRA
jgi:hypothetical protein